MSCPVLDAQSAVFRSLGDPTRRGLFERCLREGALTVGALAAGAGISQPAASQHLAQLKQAGLVQRQRHGRSTLYSACPSGLQPLADWLRFYQQFWNQHFDQLETFLNEMEP